MPIIPPLLEAQDLTIRHRKNDSPAVANVSLSVLPSTCLAIVGPNGAGKSTLLRALAGLSSNFVSGFIRVGGDTLSNITARELARRRAFVPQDNPMPFSFTVWEAVALGDPEGARPDSVTAALARFDLSGFAQRSVLALSGGERQRVALARAFAQNAPLLLLDEPTAHQDLRYAGRVLKETSAFVREEQDGTAAIAVLHDLNLARQWADRILLLQKGEIRGFGPPEEVLTDSTLSEVYGTNVATSPYIYAK